MIDALQYSLEVTEEFMLPIMNQVKDLNACVDFLEKFNLPISANSFNLNFRFDGYNHYDEGFLYIKTDNKEIKEKWKKILDGTIDIDETRRKQVASRYKFFDDPVVHEKALVELERRKASNTDILRTYGLNL